MLYWEFRSMLTLDPYSTPGAEIRGGEAEASAATFALWMERMEAFAPAGLADQDLYPAESGAARPTTAEAPAMLSKALSAVAAAHPSAPPAMAAFAVVMAYAARLSGDGEICVGMRPPASVGGFSGDGRFAPLPVGLAGGETVADVLRAVSGPVNDAAEWPSLAGFIEDDELPGGWNGDIPFAVSFADDFEPGESSVDVGLAIAADGAMRWRLSENIAPVYVALLHERLTVFAEALAEQPDMPVADAPIMDEAERKETVADWNRTGPAYPYGGGLIGMLEAKAAKKSEKAAVLFKDEVVSYADFNGRVNQLARKLRAMGVGKDTFVCLCLDRSVEMVVAIWATMKAGGAYVPLNVDDPAGRLQEIIQDCQPKVVLTQERFRGNLPVGVAPILTLDDSWPAEAGAYETTNPHFPVSPGDVAYMIYTSGSTGKPKGVLVEHEAIFNRIVWMQDEFGLKPSDRVLQKTPYTFDVSVWEFLWAPIVGAGVVVAEPGGHMAPGYMLGLIAEAGVTHMHFVPSVLRIFLMMPGVDQLPLKKVFCSGEALGHDLTQEFFSKSGAGLHNLYGPTEAAVDVSHWACEREPEAPRVPIGKPISNVGLYILDENDRPVPIGAPGELHIGGVCLARGYWAREDLTAERFVDIDIADAPHGRFYRTGDLARFLPNGDIEYLGRNDFQVKVHGIRIELGEIENTIRELDDVQDAVVTAEGEGPAKALVGYVVANGAPASMEDLILKRLAEKLPPYMSPRDLHFIDSMPLSVSGKVDRKKLPSMIPQMEDGGAGRFG